MTTARPSPPRKSPSVRGIPTSLAGQVLGRLRAAGFISSARGAQGGHQLALAPEEIRLDRVVEALEGPLTLAACLERGAQAGRASERCTGAAAQVRLWDDVRAAILDTLADRTIADLAAGIGLAGFTGRRSVPHLDQPADHQL